MKNTPVITSNKDWQDLIGIQFALGGSNPQFGLNCYGLVREVYKSLQIELPERQDESLDVETAVEGAGNDWTLLSEPVPYAVALIRSAGTASMFHLAIVTPELTLLHAVPKKGVIVSRMADYQDRIVGVYRYTPGVGERLPLADGTTGRLIGAIAITIAAIAASVYTGGASLTVLGPTWSAVAGATAAAAVSIGGNLILNAIAPIKQDQGQNSGPVGNSSTYTWDGIQNDFKQGSPKAMIFGRVKVGGQIISEKTWFDGLGNEYLDTLICPAVGRVTRFIGIQLNDTDVSLYKNTAAVFRPGDNQQTPLDMFNKIYTQYSSAAKIPYDASSTDPVNSIQFSSKSELNGIRFIISAPNGIYEIDEDYIPHDVTFQIQYRPSGDVSWSALPTIDPNYAVQHPFIYRLNGVFIGAANPFTLTDAEAGFSNKFIMGDSFELVIGVTTYYCTQAGTLTTDAIQFNAFTDVGKTAAFAGTLTNGVYNVSDSSVKRYTGTADWSYFDEASGTVYTQVTPVLAIETEVSTKAIFCRVVVESDTITWARLLVKYQKTSDSAWIDLETFDAGYPPQYTYEESTDTWVAVSSPPIGSTYRDIDVSGLIAGFYRLAVIVDNSSGGAPTANDVRFDNIALDTASTDGIFTILGDVNNPSKAAIKQIELLNMTEGFYDFRIWRTTADVTATTWQDDVYLRGYAEVLDRVLAYPGHALIGIRAMATDRLYGGRPRMTSIATGEPLTVPAANLSTTSVSDLGIVDTYLLVNNVIVSGMRKVLIDTILNTPDGSYYWLVRMDSAGYADSTHLLTKHFLRVHTWEISGDQTYVYLQDAEAIPDDTELLLFNENADPYVSRHTAWAVAKMLIVGSHGRITAAGIDWDAFAAWDAWNMEIKAATGQPRHLYDAVIDFNTDLWSLAMKVAQSARGNLMKKGNKYSVWMDKATSVSWATVETSLFGEGNSNNVIISPIPRSDRANILVTSFLNQIANYDQKDISIEDIQNEEFPIVKTIPTQVGVVRESQVEDLLNFMLLQNRYVGTAASLEAGIDSVGVIVGDVFRLASPAKDFSLSGRIVSVGASEVVLDQTFYPEADETYELTVWGSDGSIYTTTSEPGDAETTSFVAPTGLSDTGYYEQPYVISKVIEERTKYRCIGLTRTADTMQAQITAIEYRDECYVND